MALYKSGQSGDSFPESAVTLVKVIDVDNYTLNVVRGVFNLVPDLTNLGIDYTTLTSDDFVVYTTRCRFGNGGGEMKFWAGASTTPYIEEYDNSNGRITLNGLRASMSGSQPGNVRADLLSVFLKLS